MFERLRVCETVLKVVFPLRCLWQNYWYDLFVEASTCYSGATVTGYGKYRVCCLEVRVQNLGSKLRLLQSSSKP